MTKKRLKSRLRRHAHVSAVKGDGKAAIETSVAISFIIPALNEERYIADCIKQFSHLDGKVAYEVIVADGGSSDKTVEIAEQLGAKAVVDKSKRKTIASGRNLGAKAARADLLVFCDADTQLEDIHAFTSRVLDEFRDMRVVAAMPRLEVFPAERTWQDRVISVLVHSFIKVCLFIGCPFSSGQCQVVRKSSFNAVQGYDRNRVHGEDSVLFAKLNRIGQIRVMSDLVILESPRRYRKYGYFNLLKTSVLSFAGQAVLKRNVLKKWERVD